PAGHRQPEGSERRLEGGDSNTEKCKIRPREGSERRLEAGDRRSRRTQTSRKGTACSHFGDWSAPGKGFTACRQHQGRTSSSPDGKQDGKRLDQGHRGSGRAKIGKWPGNPAGPGPSSNQGRRPWG